MKNKRVNLTSRAASSSAAAAARQSAPAEALHRLMCDDRLAGAVLIGRIGSGRRAAVDCALAGMEPRPPVVHLTGSPFAAAARYGVLSLLLARLQVSPSISRHELVRTIADRLGEERKIVTLSSPELIDGESAAVLAQLAAMRKIFLVIICTRHSELPADLSALSRSVLLVRIEVPSMGVREARTHLESELGAPVSMFAAASMWHLCRASRALMRQLSREYVARGKLRLDGGSWILVPGPFHSPPAIRVPQLASLVQEERRLLLTLAIGGPASLTGLRRCGLAEPASSLRARGVITTGETPTGIVDIAIPLLAYTIRERVDAHELTAVEPDLAVLHADPRCAKVLTKVRALRDIGDDRAGIEAVEDFDREGGFSADAWQADHAKLALLLDIHVGALRLLGRADDAERMLARIRQDVTAAVRSRPGEQALIKAEQHVQLLASQAAVLAGHPVTIADLTKVLWQTEALHYRALAIQAEAMALTGQARESMAVADAVDESMSTLRLSGVLDHMTPWESADIDCTLLRARLLSGEWRAAGQTARALADGRHSVPAAIAFGDLIGGLLAALAHSTERATPTLLPASRQLTASSDGPEPAAVRAAGAFCLAGGADAPTDPAEEGPSRAPTNFVEWSGAILTCLRLARDDPATAVLHLLDLSELCEDAQVLEMATLATALRLGDTSAAIRLGELSAQASAPAADGFDLLARGVTAGDGHAIAAGLAELVDHGQLLYSHGSGGALLERVGVRERRRILEARVGSDGPSAAPDQPVSHSQPAWLSPLTRREAQVAKQAIAGMSNTEIARANGVSVRTVEGHLYQVYSKLHVRNRQELTAIARSRHAVGPS